MVISVTDSLHPLYKKVLQQASGVLGISVANLPSRNTQLLDSGLIHKMVTLGFWNECDLIRIHATDGNRVFAGINWKTPASNQIVETGTPTYTSKKGFQGLNTSNYIREQFLPTGSGVKFTKLDHSFYLYQTDNASGIASGGYITTAPAGGVLFITRTSPSLHGWYSFSGELAWPSAESDLSGGYMFRRVSDTSVFLYKNGVQVGTNAGNTTRDVGINLYTTLYNRQGTATGPVAGSHIGGLVLGSSNVLAGFHTHFKYRFDKL